MTPGKFPPLLMPDADSRRASTRVDTHLAVAGVAFVSAVGVVALWWAALFYFRDSLHVGDNARSTWTAVIVVLGVAGTGLLYPAIRALKHALRSASLVRSEQRHQARVEAERVTNWCWYVLGLGLSLVIITAMIYFVSANDGTIRRTFLNWDVLGSHDTRRAIRKGFVLNVKIFLVAEFFVLIWALFIAVLRMLPGRATAPVRFLAIAYTDLFRGLPAIMAIYLIAFGIQLSQFPVLKELTLTQQVILALVLVYGAYVAEVYRAGIESIHWSQVAAARSLGLTGPQTMRHVIVPQAVRRVIPPLLNDFIGLQKDTALVSSIGLLDVFNRTKLVQSKYFNLSPLLGAALCFIIITIPLARFTDYLIRKDQRRTRSGS